MLKNTTAPHRPVLAGTVGGVVGFVCVWLVLDHSGYEPWPLFWGGAVYGLGVGVGSTLAYLAAGGTSPAGAAGSGALAALASTCGVFAILVAGERGETELGEVVLGAILVFLYYAVPLGFLLLVVPAVAVALTLTGAVWLGGQLAGREETESRRS